MTYMITNAEKIRRLPWNTAMGATNTVFGLLTYFGPTFVLFLSELNMSNTQIGLLLSFFPFTGIVAVLIAPAVARFGYKRTFVTFFGTRKVITAGLLLVPWVQSRFGSELVLLYVLVITLGFALCRSIAETGLYPWAQEYIPNNIRGRYAAVNDIISRFTGIASLAVASFILGLSAGMDRFMLLFAIGLVFGAAAVWSASHIPGGAPVPKTDAQNISHRHLFRVLRDKNFLWYIAGIGILTIGTTPIGSFMPLYMERQVGLSESFVVLMQVGGIVGGLSATYLMGWAADRYGSKPVMLSGLYIKIALPLAYLLIPRFSPLSLPVAVLISFVNGAADIAWLIGSGRLLYNKVVPSEKRAEYMAMYYALVGLIGGLSQVAGGRALDFTQGLTGQFLIFPVDPFFPLFVLAIVLTAVSAIVFWRVQPDSKVSAGEFVSMFIHGNPALALESVFRYHRARDERQTVVMTERMGQTKSPLTVDELLEALYDPRFNVRFEAIISIARMEADPRLVDALTDIVDGTELSLSVISAWALGRLGDPRAVPSLRLGLESQYRSIQAHCARSLGTLGDTETAPLIFRRLEIETDKGLRIAYASALGNLHYVESLDTLLEVLDETGNEGARLELALAVARIVGHEHHFIRLLRQIRHDKGTAASQDIMVFKRRYHTDDPEILDLIRQSADAFAKDEMEEGISLLCSLIHTLPPEAHTPPGRKVLVACAERFDTYKAGRIEYLLLALHTLDAAMAG
jgi:MHS family proline/betaine transporter-like MFS transporter